MGAPRGTHMGARRVPIEQPEGVRHEKRKKKHAQVCQKIATKKAQIYHPKGDIFSRTYVGLMCTQGVHIWGPNGPH